MESVIPKSLYRNPALPVNAEGYVLRGASIGIFIILVVIGVGLSGCLGKSEGTGAYAENQNGATGDPHVVPSIFGGYNIKGDTEGYGFKAVNPNGMGISPGGKAEIVGIIENGKGIVYFDKEGARGADVVVNKGGFAVDQWDLFPVLPELNEQGLIKAQLDLDKLKEEYGLSSGDLINVANAEVRSPRPFVDFVVL